MAMRRTKQDFTPRPIVAVNKTYTDEYRESCFMAWYEAGCPKGTRFVTAMPLDDDGRSPHLNVLNDWRRKLGWEERASELNAQVRKEIEKKAVIAKIEMFERHADVARTLIDQGKAWFENHEIDTPATAVRAIVEGVKIERESIGIPDALRKVSTMTQSQLESLVDHLVSNMNQDDSHRIAEEIDENTIEGEFEETDESLTDE